MSRRQIFLERILYAIAFLNNVEPKPNNILKILTEKLFPPPTFIADNIKTWLYYNTVPFEGSPTEVKLVEGINKIFAWEQPPHKISNLEVNWEDVDLPAIIRSKVEEAIRKRESKRRKLVNGIIYPDLWGIDPSDLDAQIRAGNLKSHSLYHSPRSPYIWDKIKISSDYPLYSNCEKGLKNLLNDNNWKSRLPKIKVIFNLGAGSASKDKFILSSVNYNAENVVFLWVDASYSMLWHTLREVLRESYANMSLYALQADFENPHMLKKLSSELLSNMQPFDEPKAFFILGFTLSNLDEIKFFTSYKKVCRQGDLFIFPMQFIPKEASEDENVLNEFKRKLLNAYNFAEGKKLSQTWLKLLDESYQDVPAPPEIEPYPFHDKIRSMCVVFNSVLHNKNEREQQVVTARSTRHYEQDYIDFLTSQGFIIRYASPPQGGVTTLLVEYVGGSEPLTGGQ